MDLSEIEAKADELAAKMLKSQQIGDIPARLEGLAHLAQIKRARDLRAEWNVHIKMRDREIAVMETAATAAEQAASHAKQRGADPVKQAIKPTVDRLHELVSYLTAQADEADGPQLGEPGSYAVGKADGRGRAYRDAATKLDEILREGWL